MDVCVRFGEAVRRRRCKLQLTQEVLAQKAMLHRTYIGDIERGRRNVALRNAERLAKALGVELSSLVK